MASIKPHGRPMPQPINSMGIHRPVRRARGLGDVASQIARRHRDQSDGRQTGQAEPARQQRARNGTTSKGAGQADHQLPGFKAL